LFAYFLLDDINKSQLCLKCLLHVDVRRLHIFLFSKRKQSIWYLITTAFMPRLSLINYNIMLCFYLVWIKFSLCYRAFIIKVSLELMSSI